MVRVFVAGGGGALGKPIVSDLVAHGHSVVATTRSPSKTDGLRAAGAEAVVMDGLDQGSVTKAVADSRPDAVVHQMSALTGVRSFKRFDDEFAVTNRLRTDGTAYLLAAARGAGARCFLAQSYSGWPNARLGGRVKTEADPLDPDPPRAMRRTLDAIRRLEAMVTSATGINGIAFRYGTLYGPGTGFAADGDIVDSVRMRKLPIVGDGAGVWSFVHVDDAATATRLVIEGRVSGVYNVVDDEPAEVSVWLPVLARALGAKAPYRMPVWLARLFIGEAGVSMMTKVRGSSNAKARQGLGWVPAYASWREGFRRSLVAASAGS